jgi:hypothetical protein
MKITLISTTLFTTLVTSVAVQRNHDAGFSLNIVEVTNSIQLCYTNLVYTYRCQDNLIADINAPAGANALRSLRRSTGSPADVTVPNVFV